MPLKYGLRARLVVDGSHVRGAARSPFFDRLLKLLRAFRAKAQQGDRMVRPVEFRLVEAISCDRDGKKCTCAANVCVDFINDFSSFFSTDAADVVSLLTWSIPKRRGSLREGREGRRFTAERS